VSKDHVQKFVSQLKGLDYLLRVKGDNQNHMYLLTKLVLSVVHDKNLVIA
jgi:E3 ubiquitin-protein ligase HUWE1